MHNSQNASDRHLAIEKRAYELYLQRGATDGNDLEDWLIAEKEIGAKGHRESSSVGIPHSKVAIATRVLESTH